MVRLALLLMLAGCDLSSVGAIHLDWTDCDGPCAEAGQVSSPLGPGVECVTGTLDLDLCVICHDGRSISTAIVCQPFYCGTPEHTHCRYQDCTVTCQ